MVQTTNVRDAVKHGKATHFPNYIRNSATDLDTFNGGWIDNTRQDIEHIFAQSVITAAGTAATLQLVLQGSNNGSDAFGLKDSGGTAITSGSATALTGASTTVPILLDIQTTQEGVQNFPNYIRVRELMAGTTKRRTGVTTVTVVRRDRGTQTTGA